MADVRVDDPADFPPQEDTVERLWTPQRMTYVLRNSEDRPTKPKSEECPFCAGPKKSDEDGLIAWRGTHVFAIMNLYPYNVGHLMICPYRHVGFITELDDAELFSQQVGRIDDIDRLRAVVTALSTARELHNLIRLGGFDELAGLLDFDRLRTLHIEARNALAALNLKQQLDDAHDTSGLLNQALEDVVFRFEKIGEGELKLADELKEVLRRTRESLASTQDPQDPKWIALRQELERLFRARKLSEVGQQEMQDNIVALRDIERRTRELDHANANLAARYGGDAKLMRVHKRLVESHGLGNHQTRLHDALSGIKHDIDEAVLGSNALLGNVAFFERSVMPIVMRNFQRSPPAPDADTRAMIRHLLVREYLGESQGRLPLG